MERFVGRDAELGLLQGAFKSRRSEFIPIYGRRRVGKSELILKFMARKRGVYYLGQQSSTALQVREFLAEAARALGMPLLAELRVAGWQQALRTVTEQWAGASPGTKLVLALDEFQWIAAASPSLLSELQHCWDRWWRDSGNVMLLLCGSYLGFMEREVLGRKSPLYGRRTAQIHLQPFGYRDAAQFHPRWSPADQARAYFLVGGVPQYLLCLDDSRSIEANIREHLLAEFAPLFHEPAFLLREELREIAPYQAVLHAVASGHGAAPAYCRGHRAAGAQPALLPPAAHRSRLPAAPLSPGTPAPEFTPGALRDRRPAAAVLVPLRVPQRERDPRRRPGACVSRPHRAVTRGVVRELFRTALSRGVAVHLSA